MRRWEGGRALCEGTVAACSNDPDATRIKECNVVQLIYVRKIATEA